MPDHDCFCAICSATVWRCEIREASGPDRRTGDGKSPSRRDDNNFVEGYDPEIISEEDIAWIGKLHILGFNPQAPGLSKAYISGPGSYDMDFYTVNVEEGDDPNFPQDHGDGPPDFRCYDNFDDDLEEVVFPFHWACYELLVRCITGVSEDTGFEEVDKDVLFRTMSSLNTSVWGALNLNYGEPAPTTDIYEDPFSGQEVFVVSPSSTRTLQAVTEAIIESNDFALPYSSDDLGLCVKQDDFSKLPSELIHKIVSLLPPEPLLNLLKASWTIDRVLRNNNTFWMGRIRCDLPWFFELERLLDYPETFQGKDLRGMFLWAHEISRTRLWMKGTFMGLANRRRIWSVCEQLRKEYLSELKQLEDGPEPDFVKNMIQERSECRYLPLVCSPVPENRKGSTVYWIHSWEDVFVKPTVLEIFWSSEGSLVGLSLAPENERRLFGTDDNTLGVVRESIDVASGVWVTGFVLHFPTFQNKDFWSHHNMETSIKGLTVIYNSGKSSCFRSTNQGYARLSLLSASSHYITGITGHKGKDKNNQQIVRLGLLQSERPVLDDYSSEHDNDNEVVVPYPTDFEEYLWGDDCSSIFGIPIWEHPTIRKVNFRAQWEDFYINFVPFEPLIWGASEQDLRSLTCLSGYVPTGDHVFEMPFQSRSTYELCGIRANFGGGHDKLQRTVGLQKQSNGSDWKEEYSSHFKIDGPGGEYINEVSVCLYDYPPNALKLRTNRDREIIWGDHQTSVWESIRVPEGEVIIGIIISFGKGAGQSLGDHKYTRSKMNSLSVLTMPLEIDDDN